MLGRNIKFHLSVLLNCLLIIILYVKVFRNFTKKVNVINKNKLNVDQRNEPDKFFIQQRIAENIPNLPIEDLDTFLSNFRGVNFSCAWYPSIMDIHIQNEYWQIFHNKNLTYNIFGAYLDKRPLVTKNKAIVRILAMIDLISENANDYPPAYCQFWFREIFLPVIVPVRTTQFIWVYAWGHHPYYSFPHILTCALPKAYSKWKPKSVSLVAAPCDKPTNIVRVIYKPLKSFEEKLDFAVCIKTLDYPYNDLSYRLVEYMEALRVLGAQKVTMYGLEVHENITKVLNYYQRTGFLEYHPFSYSLKYSNLPEYRHRQIKTRLDEFILHESLIYTDCIYKNMYRFKYIAVLDIDELVIPFKNYENWQDLVKVAEVSKDPKCKSFSSFCFYCAYFPKYDNNFTFTKQYPQYFYMLQHVQRVKNYAGYGSATKCFHNTERIISAHNHYPIHFRADCRDYTFNSSDAQLNHYREPPFKYNISNLVIDKGLRKFGNQIMKTSLQIFEELDFFEKL